MKALFRSLSYQIKSATNNFIRNFAMSFVSASAITITLVLISIFAITAFNIEFLSNNIKANIKIRVGIELHADANQKLLLQQEITKLEQVSQIAYSTKEQELTLYLENTKQDQQLLQQFEGDKNPLRDVYIILLKDQYQNLNSLEEVANIISKMENVAIVDYGGDSVKTLIYSLEFIKLIGFGLALILSFLSIFLVANTIKATIYNRRKEIYIMKNVGASNSFIQLPFIIEGIYISLLGSLLPIILIFIAYFSFSAYINSLLSSSIVLIPPLPFLIILSIFLLIISIVVGIMGSYQAISRYMEHKR